MSDNLDKAFDDLGNEGAARAEAAFKQGVQECGELAGHLCPVGIYDNKRGRNGKTGGELVLSLFAEYLGRDGDSLKARFGSPLPYAAVQHDVAFCHPGIYSGRPGDKYAAKYFSRAVAMVFGDGEDPLGRFTGAKPATFKELLQGY